MFNGVYTAIVTPFNGEGCIDFDRLRDLIERQIEAGVDGVVPVGTTAQGPFQNYTLLEEGLKARTLAVRELRGNSGEAEVNAVDSAGNTALIAASAFGHAELVDLLPGHDREHQILGLYGDQLLLVHPDQLSVHPHDRWRGHRDVDVRSPRVDGLL